MLSKWQGASAFQLMTSCSLDVAQRAAVRSGLQDEHGGSARGVCRYQTYSRWGGNPGLASGDQLSTWCFNKPPMQPVQCPWGLETTLSVADSLQTFLGWGDGRGRGFLPVVQQPRRAGLQAPPPSP